MQQLLRRGAAVTQHRTEEALDASWDDLKSFLACARHKSFRNAAEVLGLTSTTLMRRIDRLEERIGFKLFLRDQSGLTLSDEGSAMIPDVTEMERYAFNIFRRASQSSHEGAGTVRVAVTEGPGNFWILPRLIDFHKTYRKITVDLRCAMEQADIAKLEADIAIQLEPPTNPDLIVAKLGRLHIYAFVSEEYRKLHAVPTLAGDTARAPGRRFRLCQGFGTYVTGRPGWNKDQLQRRRSLRNRTRRRNGISADFADGDGSQTGGRRSRRPPSRRPLACLSQGVSQLRPAQDRHRLDQEDLRSQDLPLLQG
jgi:DNA-binding transcriptional LysR family regulator